MKKKVLKTFEIFLFSNFQFPKTPLILLFHANRVSPIWYLYRVVFTKKNFLALNRVDFGIETYVFRFWAKFISTLHNWIWSKLRLESTLLPQNEFSCNRRCAPMISNRSAMNKIIRHRILSLNCSCLHFWILQVAFNLTMLGCMSRVSHSLEKTTRLVDRQFQDVQMTF